MSMTVTVGVQAYKVGLKTFIVFFPNQPESDVKKMTLKCGLNLPRLHNREG
ncbi:protein of unknown function [Xenorhabdus bovienii]|uniref:Uncharacterized protein n=1 Tax=Xenorhabdus bovienii TaxID=40576 RepID=A0A0B6X8U6_XENBV|nr:protein of unknown function [Xenorhabdus bovienii]